MKIIRMELKNINLFKDNKLEIDFFAEKRVYEVEREEKVVSNLFNNIFKLNSLAFIGINASGKTVTLKIISDILKIYINNMSLNNTNYITNYFDDQLDVKVLLTNGNYLYEIQSIIKKDEFNNLFFLNEELKTTKIKRSLNKKGLDNLEEIFKDIKAIKRIDVESEFLKREDSIFSGILNKEDENHIFDMNMLTNINVPVFSSSKLPINFINYLDNSIEEFKVIQEDLTIKPKVKYLLKFKGSEKEFKLNDSDLEKYLSSGTIKGLNILVVASFVLKSGGYLIVDEIENHLNKAIVLNLLKLFTSDTNKNGATIIFTTHYSEILDSLTRSDSIYVTNKQTSIGVKKFCTLALNYDRTDKKKSDLFLSGKISASPSYQDYINLKRELFKNIA